MSCKKERKRKRWGRRLKLRVRLFSLYLLFCEINRAEVRADFVFAGERLQSVPSTLERDYTQNNELQYIMSEWRNCTSSCCLLFDERTSAPVLTFCETSRGKAPAMSVETNSRVLLRTRAKKVHIFLMFRDAAEHKSSPFFLHLAPLKHLHSLVKVLGFVLKQLIKTLIAMLRRSVNPPPKKKKSLYNFSKIGENIGKQNL